MVDVNWLYSHSRGLYMEINEVSPELNLESLESRLEMESVAALAAPPSDTTTPVSICHFW